MKSLLLTLILISLPAADADKPVFGFIQPAAQVDGDLFSQDPNCTDYHQGCMRIKWELWRTPVASQVCRTSCNNPCRFPGMSKNANEKPEGFDVAACVRQCLNRKPIGDLLKYHSKGKPKCIVIHHSSSPARDKSPIAKEQASYEDAMTFDPARGDRVQKSGGGKCQWGDTPYNYQIDSYGNLIEGRSPDIQPDTNTRGELDVDGKINIEVDGDYRTVDKKSDGSCAPVKGDRFSDKQLAILKKTVDYLRHKYNTNYVTAHMWLAATDCPGDDVVTKLEKAGVLTGCPDDKHNPHKQQKNDQLSCVGAAQAR
jgi:hypothetical protein